MPSNNEPLSSLAYVLHSKVYQENSLIIEVLTEQNGRIQLIAKGIKKSKKGLSFLLQSFQLLQIQYLLRPGLSIFVDVELVIANSTAENNFKDNKVLYSAYYMNELLIRLLPNHEQVDEIFRLYQQSIQSLLNISRLENAMIKAEPLLRLFEIKLLVELGYEINLEREALNNKAIKENKNYVYCEHLGFVEYEQFKVPHFNIKCYPQVSSIIEGSTIITLANENLDCIQSNQDCRLQVKNLLRSILNLYLGDKPLKTRELYQQLFVQKS